jgi:hypothetical protein
MNIPICLQLATPSSAQYQITQTTTPNGNNLYRTKIYLLFYQVYSTGQSSQNQYSLSDIKKGNWIAGTYGSFAWRIYNIIGPITTIRVGSQEFDSIIVDLEDVDNYNMMIDSTYTSGYPSDLQQYIYFTLNSDGLPIFSPLYGNYANA